MNAINPIPTLSLPIAEILQQAQGSSSKALQLAAALGYQTACRDYDQATSLLKSSKEES